MLVYDGILGVDVGGMGAIGGVVGGVDTVDGFDVVEGLGVGGTVGDAFDVGVGGEVTAVL